MKFRFVIKHAGAGSERIATLTGFARSNDANIETPTAALNTRGASVTHLTADVVARVFPTPQLLWIPLSTSQQLETGLKLYGEGITNFAGLSGHISCATFYDISDEIPEGHFEKDCVPLWTRNGKQMISADRYMEIMEAFKPDIMLAIADGRVAMNEGHKRTSKSVERTCNMLDVCVKRLNNSTLLQDTALIGVLVGGSNKIERRKCLERLMQHRETLSGYALSGITEGGSTPLHMSVEQIESVLEDVAKTLPLDKLRILEGCWNPAVIVAAIEHGWDLFDGSYPVKLTNSGKALTLKFDGTTPHDELCILDLNDQRYKEDFSPVLKGCTCLTCTNHTRAYINHLLITKELLATVLLNIHNLHHFDEMFREARRHIASNTFHTFKSIITGQYNDYKLKQPDIEKEIPPRNKQNRNKKKKIGSEEKEDLKKEGDGSL